MERNTPRLPACRLPLTAGTNFRIVPVPSVPTDGWARRSFLT